jgi:2-hydroxychromene-2-carboxylate isomerase
VRKVDFWYEFASTYSYPAAMRVEALAAARGVALNWRPFLLGPIFAGRGMMDSPFNLDAAKGRYMWSDLARICARHSLPLRRPDPFPQNSLLASRVALALDDARRPEFSRAVFGAEFGDGAPIAERATIAAILEAMGLDGDAIFGRADQGPATRRNGARGKPRHFRRAQPHHRRRRDFLGQRPARGRARLGAGCEAIRGAPDDSTIAHCTA